MGIEDESHEDVTAEGEEEKKGKPPGEPPWQQGIKEAKKIMKACLKAGDEVFTCHFQAAAHDVHSCKLGPGVLEVAMCENVTNIGIAMYQSIVMMEMERGRAAGLKMQQLAGNVEGYAGLLLKPRG